MKNIHILPTDKPSRLKQNKITNKLSIVNKGIDLTAYIPIDIYITSDEEIKEGDWFLFKVIGAPFDYRIHNCKYITDEGYVVSEKELNCDLLDCKKIILALTTDQSLDDVQSIDYEFLEWFINNPSCEEVEVAENWNYPLDKKWQYKIIIPKEETKEKI